MSAILRQLSSPGRLCWLYHRECHSPVCDEIVIQTRQVSTAAILELNRRLYINTQGAAALYGAQNLLFLLLQQLLLNRQVLDDGCRVLQGGESCDVVKCGILSESASRGRRQKALVFVAERHGESASDG